MITARRVGLLLTILAAVTWFTVWAPATPTHADTVKDSATGQSATRPAEVNQLAPDFTLKDCFGKSFMLSEFRGKIVILEWLNQACPISREAHEKLKMQNTYKKYAEKGVVWLGVDSTAGTSAESNRVYAAKMGMAYPVLLDPDGKAGHSFQAKRTPHIFVIDTQGKLAYQGAIDDRKDKNYAAAAVEDLLANRPVAKPKTEAYGCTIKYMNAQK